MIVRQVYVIDATVQGPDARWRFIDDDALRRQIWDLTSTAPKGSAVRLVVGAMHAPWPADMTGSVSRFEEHWVWLVRDYAVQIEGSPGAVEDWSASLSQCIPQATTTPRSSS